ncbi:MAG: FxsA family protein [Deltaproteobacteria bacterium]|nr:FxsA family protein [Candidatus Anaeroferrophillus wilburensis]MBN2888253.1 FxsA family protein [Deltaproteobacteria bacterium]
MLLKLFLAFTLVPVVEIYFLIKAGQLIGAFNTILLIIGTGFAGAWLARQQGVQAMFQVRASLQQGIMPAEEIIDALLILIAGIVLLTPGLLTDFAGLLLLIPATRYRFKRYLRQRFDEWIATHEVHITRF